MSIILQFSEGILVVDEDLLVRHSGYFEALFSGRYADSHNKIVQMEYGEKDIFNLIIQILDGTTNRISCELTESVYDIMTYYCMQNNRFNPIFLLVNNCRYELEYKNGIDIYYVSPFHAGMTSVPKESLKRLSINENDDGDDEIEWNDNIIGQRLATFIKIDDCIDHYSLTEKDQLIGKTILQCGSDLHSDLESGGYIVGIVEKDRIIVINKGAIIVNYNYKRNRRFLTFTGERNDCISWKNSDTFVRVNFVYPEN